MIFGQVVNGIMELVGGPWGQLTIFPMNDLIDRQNPTHLIKILGSTEVLHLIHTQLHFGRPPSDNIRIRQIFSPTGSLSRHIFSLSSKGLLRSLSSLC